MTTQSIAEWLTETLRQIGIRAVITSNKISNSSQVIITLSTWKAIEIECRDGMATIFSVMYAVNSDTKSITRIESFEYCDPVFVNNVIRTISNLTRIIDRPYW